METSPGTEGVAGVRAPAFIERLRLRSSRWCRCSVAGVRAPAFIERKSASRMPTSGRSVAGVRAPAFIERGIETYGIKSVMADWHLSQPWWNKVTEAIPMGET